MIYVYLAMSARPVPHAAAAWYAIFADEVYPDMFGSNINTTGPKELLRASNEILKTTTGDITIICKADYLWQTLSPDKLGTWIDDGFLSVPAKNREEIIELAKTIQTYEGSVTFRRPEDKEEKKILDKVCDLAAEKLKSLLATLPSVV